MTPVDIDLGRLIVAALGAGVAVVAIVVGHKRVVAKRDNVDLTDDVLDQRVEVMANRYGDLGRIYQARGDLDAAEAMHQTALAINEELGRKECMAGDYGNLGRIYYMRGDVGAARTSWKRALALFEEVGAQPSTECISWLAPRGRRGIEALNRPPPPGVDSRPEKR